MRTTQQQLMMMGLTAVAIIAGSAAVSAFEILGIEIPELKPVSVERTPGFPLLHSEPKHLLGIN
jgi:hypothetical protein